APARISAMSERESMPVDVVIVGAGPAGLAAAVRLKQLDPALEVVVLEKGSEVGAHILSGAVIDPRALDELLPDWREECPLAEVLGGRVFPGFPASEVLFDGEGAVIGVATQDMGVAADGSHKPDYQPGIELHARYALFAEGARGHLTKRLKARFGLDADCQPQ